tara:strand:- start:2209 stop:3282 length:1074 start_codon:yes stop_codon:yes gene_type:complete
MANQNFRTPIFYPDLIGFVRDRGSTVITQQTGTNLIAMPTGSTKEDLVDGRPLNIVTFDTSSATSSDHLLFNFNTGTGNFRVDFVAILNHNMNSADTRLKVFAGNVVSDVEAINGGNAETADVDWSSVNATEIINADTIAATDSDKSLTVTPAQDGHTLFKFDNVALRYWGIQFEGTDSDDFDDTYDLHLGNIIIGESYTMPTSPDLSIKRTVVYDGINIQKSIGGQKFASATSFGPTITTPNIYQVSRSPFNTGDYDNYMIGGRQVFDLNFSYVNSSDLIPTNKQTLNYTEDSVLGDVWNVTNGPMRPFIFGVDSTITGNTAESSYLYARFGMNSLQLNQVASDVYNVNLKIEEEF